MINEPYANTLTSSYAHGDMTAIRKNYLHRAIRRHGGQLVFGREAIVQAALEDIAHLPPKCFSVTADLHNFVATAWNLPDGTQVRRHHWARFEDAFLSKETIIDNCAHRPPPAHSHSPLGELFSGMGQIGVGDLSGHDELTHALNTLWNGRSIGIMDSLYAPEAVWVGTSASGDKDALKAWWLAQFITYPKSHTTIESKITSENKVALLWQWGRIKSNGTRDRVTGSSLLTFDDGKIVRDETLVDGG